MIATRGRFEVRARSAAALSSIWSSEKWEIILKLQPVLRENLETILQEKELRRDYIRNKFDGLRRPMKLARDAGGSEISPHPKSNLFPHYNTVANAVSGAANVGTIWQIVPQMAKALSLYIFLNCKR